VTKRTARGTETRQRIIKAATDLFHRQGYRATSPDAIIDASGTGKGQFYHHFRNKDDLVHAVLQTHLQAIEAGAAPIKYDIDSWADLERWFLDHIALQKRYRMTRGCPLGTIGNEVTEADELFRLDLSQIFEVVKSRLVAFFTREKALGRLVAAANEETMADFCIALVQGTMFHAKIKRSSQIGEALLQEAMAHFRQYMIPPPGTADRVH
jgi:TetR/AcrR family transcriptional regulator, transcriptional repressor for nem operon